MPDREKVIRGLECLSRLSQDGTCAGCAYFRPFADDPDTGWCDRIEATKDALTLLREQEPEIIRCKDCKHYVPDIQTCNNGVDGILLPDWFCADGERR